MNVPEGWEKKELGELGRWKGGGTPSKANQEFWTAGTIPWISPKDMKSKQIGDAEDYITEEAMKKSSASLIPLNSIIIVTRSGILRHSLPVAVTTKKLTINQDIKALTPYENFDTSFLANLMWSLEKPLLDGCQKEGTTVESIDFEVLKKFPVIIPPLPEQRKIAVILSTWDDSLSTLARLINTKRQQKQALAEQLLAGKRRLKGFKEEWEEKRIGEVAFINPSEDAKKSEGDFIKMEDISESGHLRKISRNTSAQIGLAGFSKFRNKDTLVAKITPCFENGKGAIVKNIRGLGLGSTEFFVIRPRVNIDPHWMYYVTRSKGFMTKGAQSMQGSGGQKRVPRDFIDNYVVKCPPQVEQQAIASVLVAFDTEIDLLTRQQVKVQEQKRGLMDLLLTGKVRVQVPEADQS